jgi:hypothetical protein
VVDQQTGWQPDPYGVHQFRFFSEDGKATLLVSDRGVTSHDPPPATESVEYPTPQPEPQPEPEPQPAPAPALQRESEPERETEASVARSIPSAALMEGSSGSGGIQTATQTRERRDEADGSAARPLMASSDGDASMDESPDFGEGVLHPETLSKPRKVAYVVVFAALALSVLGLAYVHLIHTSRNQQASSTASTTTTSLGAPKTTTTVGLPSAPQPSPTTAASALVSSWAGENRAVALSVATPSAVDTLFGATYASGMAIDRGCSTSAPPVVCTFGPPGGASPTDPIYEVYVSQTPGGWYVSTVKIEN